MSESAQGIAQATRPIEARRGIAPLVLPAALTVLIVACAHTPRSGSPPPAAASPEAGPAPAQTAQTAPAPIRAVSAPTAPGVGEPARPAAAPVRTVTPATTGSHRAAPAPAAQASPPGVPAQPEARAAAPRTAPATQAPLPPQPQPQPQPQPPALDLTSLQQRLRETRAIGVFTKLSLKNQVDDLLGEFRDYHRNHGSVRLAQLRQSYDLLLMKVLSLLQNGDPSLAGAISASREAIWAVLINPAKFAVYTQS